MMKTFGCVLVLAVASYAATSAAWAQTAAEPTFEIEAPASGAEVELAPGYQRPDRAITEPEREAIRPFGDVLEDRDTPYAPINEFAGQRRQYDPGLIGIVLGNAKRAVIGGEE